MRIIASATGLGAALFLASCGGQEENGEFTTEDGAQGEYTIDRETGETRMSLETEEGTATLRSGKDVPIDLPGGFSLYPGSRVTSNSVIEQGERTGSMILFEADATPEDIIAHYRKQAEAAGIELQMDAKMGESVMVAGENEADAIAFQVSATGADGTTTGQLFIGRMPE
ncbi:hypothetical protein Ga0102493_112002 [Erythrobacter litoralis]|jgi:hypothetical protein|uniref:Lipoprotein n=1 Tax=Erythrobacter litoralis TaxID=39960 RepID=A0A074MMS9_9SPHN|nr:hypothetical protein [Erythrobacter litoralis]AOL23021.1 hypothetical protein Ga0102493_112002 [Erythrobacter litoralis]KEO93113.1 hypothetical protein EH32_12870 [Erythrobacter litoralis]MEE4338449.1 hypothetical protein [Erythrobacter sp.]